MRLARSCGDHQEQAPEAASSPFGEVRRTWEVVTTTLALITAVYLILNTIEPTRDVLERYVGRRDIDALAAVVAVMLEVAIVAIYQLGRQVHQQPVRL